jgi:hypothetical protein
VLLLLLALTAVSAVTAQLRCVDAARETALAAARGVPDAASAGQRIAPAGASITVDRSGPHVHVRVSARLEPLGEGLPGIDVSASSVAEAEPGELGAAP